MYRIFWSIRPPASACKTCEGVGGSSLSRSTFGVSDSEVLEEARDAVVCAVRKRVISSYVADVLLSVINCVVMSGAVVLSQTTERTSAGGSLGRLGGSLVT